MNFTTHQLGGFYMNEVPQGLGIVLNRTTSQQVLGLSLDAVCASIQLHVKAFTELKTSKEQMLKYITKTIQEVKENPPTAKYMIQFLSAVEYMEQNGMMPVNDTNGMCYMRAA